MNLKLQRYYLIVFALIFLVLEGCGTNNKQASNSNNDGEQSFWNDAPFAFTRGDDGYYFISENKIMYYENAREEAYPVCGKAECQHNDDSCNAFLSPEYYSQSIWYYKDNLYLLKFNEEKNEVMLVRFTKDCSQEKELFVIAHVSMQRNGEIGLVFHDDFVYVYDILGSENENITITKMSLDGSRTEIIYSEDSGANAIASVKSYGDNLMFTVTTRKLVGEQIECSMSGIYGYDYDTGEITTIVDAQVCDYSMDMQNHILYYFVFGEGVFKKDMNSDKTEQIYECESHNQFSQISFDGNNIYICNQRMQTIGLFYQPYIWIIDVNGNILNKLKTEFTFFGDEKYLFAVNNKQQFVIMKKNNISELDDNDWKVIGNS